MPTVTILLNGRNYDIACGPGEEARVEEVAARLRDRMEGISRSLGNAQENFLFAVTALLLADELEQREKELSESLAILHHIAARDLGQRLGFLQATRAFDRLNSALSFLHTELHGAFAPAWTAFKLPEHATKEKDMLRKLARERAAETYAHLEHMLSNPAWLAGDHRTVADAYLIGLARWGEDLNLFDLKREASG